MTCDSCRNLSESTTRQEQLAFIPPSSIPMPDGSPLPERSKNLDLLANIRSLPADHPVFVAARTYALSLSLSLTPAVLPLLASRSDQKRRLRLYKVLRNELGTRGFAFSMAIAVGGGAFIDNVWQWLNTRGQSERTQLSCYPTKIRQWLDRICVSPITRTFISNLIPSFIAILLLQRHRWEPNRASIPFTIPISPARRMHSRVSDTLDLSLLLLIRALDAALQGKLIHMAQTHWNDKLQSPEIRSVHDIRARAARMTDKIDAFLFWISSSR